MKFALFMALSVRRVILSRMVRPTSLWYVFLPFWYEEPDAKSKQTSMFVPEPVVSLSLKPQGQESPNFSRALNRFKKEDPTFRVHVDPESKEVRTSTPF